MQPACATKTSDARETYESRRLAHRAAEDGLRRIERRISWLRLALFATLLVLAGPALFGDRLAPAWLLVPLGGFAVLVAWHARAIRGRERAGRAAAFYARGLERLDDRWAGRGSGGARHLRVEHPYAADLDLFGRGSLFELLDATRTRPGEETLAAWLCSAASPAAVRARQAAVEELRPRLDLREALALAGEDVRSDLDPQRLGEWAQSPAVLAPGGTSIAAGLLGAANLLALGAWPFLPQAAWVLAVSLVLSAALGLRLRGRVRQVLSAVDRPSHELELLSSILSVVERERFASPLLVALRERLQTGGAMPSRRIAALARLVQIHDSRGNMIFAPLAALGLVGTQLACAVERWRAGCGEGVARWLAATGEIEALSSLAGHAYEHPGDPFPEIVDRGPCLEIEGAGHPLLPEGRCVRNDVRLDRELQLLLVSGSNMSGKSTLLRTVGVNVVLALAGAPVRASRMRVSALSVGASMRVADSLQEGLSHFYAEIRRLAMIVGLGETGAPLLFLLDEILHGTNSHDRRIGAEALIRNLVETGAVGMVTTHDLALARIAEDLGPRAANVHFEDRLEQGRIVFDYRLRPGVVRKGNALELMRSIGLRV